jgi:hypothetical protein
MCAQLSILWSTDDTAEGDESPYTQAQLWKWLEQSFTSDHSATEGVLFGCGGALAVSGTASPISIADGAAYVLGTPYWNTAAVEEAISTPAIGTTGFRVVLSKVWATETTRIDVLVSADGVASAPAVTQTDNTKWEITLATGTITTGGVIALTDARAYCHFATKVSAEMIDAGVITTTQIAAAAAITGSQLAADAGIVAGQIANRTRSFLVPPHSIFVGTYTGEYATVACPDAAGTYLNGAFRVPSDFASAMTAKEVWALGSFSGNLRVYSSYRAAGLGELASTHSYEDTATIAVGNGYNEIHSQSLAAVALGDYVIIQTLRAGADALDTVGQAVEFVGWLIEYTADS